jgi:hypothetical protein
VFETLQNLPRLFWGLSAFVVLLILIPWLWVKAGERESELYREHLREERRAADLMNDDERDCAA